ncbi:MAG: methyl-accepting chemotaxis protein, partial [Candidatus Promineifilaceae bacterium]
SRYGLLAYGSSFDQIGTLTHSVEDAAILLEIMAGEDDFDATALAAVRAMPSEPYYEIIQKDDQSSIRYVSAMIMSEGCVGCHNSHPDSPKKDWQVGDVRGGLEVIVPIESADAGIRQGTSQLATVVLIGMFLLAGLIWLLLQRTVMNPVGAIITASDKVEAGQFTSRAPVQSRDELGVMAQRFNAMLDRTEQSMLAVRQQNTLLETSVNNLLDDVAQAANGDLTVSADGHHGATHAIGEAFNTMLGQMRRIIQQVQETSLQVNAAAQQIRTKAAQLEEASTHQAVQISSTVNSIESMSASIQEVSANSVHSASIGAQAKVSAERGTQSVEDTIKGMIRLEQQIRDTTIRVETLRGNSLEIGQIVELIEDIADRTMILALNASIQAAKAGPSGASFRVIAEEVERLAKHSADATQQISLLINRNQTETGLLANAISATSAEIEKGSRLARQAGGALKEISTVSEQFAELSQIISQSARHQAHTSASLTDTMHEIADITHRNAAGTRETSASLQNLSRLTTELRESVSIFKVYANGKTRR